MKKSGFSKTAVLALAGALMAGCQSGVTGPSLSATVQNVALQPTIAGLEGGQNLCCCHLSGQVTNTSTVPEHAELTFPAKAADGTLLGTAMTIQRDIPPGATRSFLAVGITAACKDVNLTQVMADRIVRLKGLFEPE